MAWIPRDRPLRPPQRLPSQALGLWEKHNNHRWNDSFYKWPVCLVTLMGPVSLHTNVGSELLGVMEADWDYQAHSRGEIRSYWLWSPVPIRTALWVDDGELQPPLLKAAWHCPYLSFWQFWYLIFKHTVCETPEGKRSLLKFWISFPFPQRQPIHSCLKVLNLVFYLLFWHLTWVTLCLWSMYDWPTYTVSIQAVISLSLSLSPSPITLSLPLSVTLCTHLPWIFRNQSQRSM